MNTLSLDELECCFHLSLRNPDEWRVVRYELDMSYETGLVEALVLGFRSASGLVKRLRFSGLRFSEFGPLSIPEAAALYVADLSGLGWSHGAIEVGEWVEGRAVLFWANSVEEVA